MAAKFKTCSNCLEPLPVSEFHKSKEREDGLQNRCKTCSKIYAKQYRVVAGARPRYSYEGALCAMNIKLPEPLKEQLDRTSRITGRSKAGIIRTALYNYFLELEKE